VSSVKGTTGRLHDLQAATLAKCPSQGAEISCIYYRGYHLGASFSRNSGPWLKLRLQRCWIGDG
jgi:hypothetical protein